MLNGEVGDALRDSAEALEVASETAQAWSRSIALRIHAETLLALEPPRIEQAEEEVRAAIDIQVRRECTFDLAWSRLALGFVCAARGERERAGEAYGMAVRMFTDMGIGAGQNYAKAALRGAARADLTQLIPRRLPVRPSKAPCGLWSALPWWL